MKINIKVNINANKIANRVINEDVKLFANQTWYRLYQNFVPMQEGNLYEDTEVTYEYIWHKSPYAERMYNGKDFDFSKEKHHLATAEWDKVAFKSQGNKLKKDIENYIKRR
ncbi:MAG: minor capsid protein [Eubacteriales bacterium]|nr:minor capsid protein [Eubacteriales bacterium]